MPAMLLPSGAFPALPRPFWRWGGETINMKVVRLSGCQAVRLLGCRGAGAGVLLWRPFSFFLWVGFAGTARSYRK